MQNLFEVVMFSIIGAALLFGFSIVLSKGRMPKDRSKNGDPFAFYGSPVKRKPETVGVPMYSSKGAEKTKVNERKTCPVCNSKLNAYETVSSFAYPSFTGQDRFMHIRGCPRCLRGSMERACPVCRTILTGDDILICRLFERATRKMHVHVLGCNHCRGPGT